MKGVTKLGLWAYLLALAVIVVDQASKHWILDVFELPLKASVPVAGPFRLTMVWNRGVSFGLLRADIDLTRWLLAAFSIVVAITIAVWVRKAVRPLLAVALGLVMGGAIGNVVDRIRFGAVADFLDFSSLHFPWVFNVADSGISIGIMLMLLDMLLQERGGAGAQTSRDAV